jgi:hypothetical protein
MDKRYLESLEAANKDLEDMVSSLSDDMDHMRYILDSYRWSLSYAFFESYDIGVNGIKDQDGYSRNTEADLFRYILGMMTEDPFAPWSRVSEDVVGEFDSICRALATDTLGIRIWEYVPDDAPKYYEITHTCRFIVSEGYESNYGGTFAHLESAFDKLWESLDG